MTVERGFVVWALAGTVALHITVPIAILNARSSDEPRPLSDMKVIEAALAYKKSDPPKQPQKDRRPKPTVETPVGVSHDDTKAPVDRPDAGPTPETDVAKKAAEFLKSHQDEEEGDEVPKPGGDFNGSARGFVEVGKGDPYFQELAADFVEAWEVPTLERGSGAAEGCLRLDATGRVIDTKFKASGNANIDRSVQLAIREIKKMRDKGDKPVPANLLQEATEKWICFNSDTFRGE